MSVLNLIQGYELVSLQSSRVTSYDNEALEQMPMHSTSVFNACKPTKNVTSKSPMQIFCQVFWIVFTVLSLCTYLYMYISYGTKVYCSKSKSAPCGKVLATFEGIPAYSNAGKGDNDCGSIVWTGRQYQCMELAIRYMLEKHGIPPSTWSTDNAKDMCRVHSADLEVTNDPKAGDLMVLTKGVYGHVAVVTKSRWLYVEVIEQNGSPCGVASYKKADVACFLTAGNAVPCMLAPFESVCGYEVGRKPNFIYACNAMSGVMQGSQCAYGCTMNSTAYNYSESNIKILRTSYCAAQA
jgi:surface antigen